MPVGPCPNSHLKGRSRSAILDMHREKGFLPGIETAVRQKRRGIVELGRDNEPGRKGTRLRDGSQACGQAGTLPEVIDELVGNAEENLLACDLPNPFHREGRVSVDFRRTDHVDHIDDASRPVGDGELGLNLEPLHNWNPCSFSISVGTTSSCIRSSSLSVSRPALSVQGGSPGRAVDH